VPGIVGDVNTDHTAMSMPETHAAISMPLSFNDGLIIDQCKATEHMHQQTLELDKEWFGLEYPDTVESLWDLDMQRTVEDLHLRALR